MLPSRSTNISAASAAVDQNGATVSSEHMVKLSATATVAGTSTGTLTVQVSNEAQPPVDSSGNPVPEHWVSTTNTVAIAGAGEYLIPAFDMSYMYVRTIFTHTNAASGTITVNLKSIGF